MNGMRSAMLLAFVVAVGLHPYFVAKGQERTSAAVDSGGIFRDCNVCPEMVVILGGSFAMGSSEVPEQRPIHEVQIADFEIGLHEVRLAELMGSGVGKEGGGRNFEQCDPTSRRYGLAAVCVSWDDAKAYVDWLRRVTGRQYRLPTEAEWEYVATRASDFGVFDMVGNAWEWVEDCWHSSYDDAPGDGTAWTTGDCSRHVMRAGASMVERIRPRTRVRVGMPSGHRGGANGFRVARSRN